MRRPRQQAAPPAAARPVALPIALPVATPVALLLAAGLLAFALELRFAWPFTADDAFITFRYASHWAEGLGPNFNAGARSEGTTSFGFLVLCTLASLVGVDLVQFAKLVGVLCALATAGLLALLVLDLERALAGGGAPAPAASERASGRALLAAAAACFLWLGFHATAVHAASGMETLLACALLTALLRVAWRAQAGGPAREPHAQRESVHASPPEPRGPASAKRAPRAAGERSPRTSFGGLALALGLVRPELNVAAAAVLALAAAGAPAPLRRALLRSALLGWILPGALYFAARAGYYGQLFPIPFYAKLAGGSCFPGAGNALALAQSVVASVALFAALPLLTAPRAFALPLAALAAVVGTALLPDPVMDFDFRYAMPALPILFALAGLGLARLVEAVAGAVAPASTLAPRSLVTALALIAAASLAAQELDPALASLRERHAYGLALEATNVRLGKLLAEYRQRVGRTPLLATGDAGAVPYYSGWRVIDTYSLNDPAIAIAGRDDPAYVLDQAPELVIVVSTKPREFEAHWANRHDQALFEASRARGMRPAVILTFSAASYLFVLAEPGSEIETELRHVYLERPPAAR